MYSVYPNNYIHIDKKTTRLFETFVVMTLIRLMHEFSRERQPLHCDVIVSKQIILN